MYKIFVILLIGGIFAVCPGCQLGTDSHNADLSEPQVEVYASEYKDKEKGEQSVVLNRRQIALAEIELGNFEQRMMQSGLKANGYLDVPPRNQAIVSSFLEGVVQRITVLQGAKVRKGQVMAYVTHPNLLTVQREYLEWVGEKVYLEAEFERQERLAQENITARKNFQRTRADYEKLKSNIRTKAAELQLLGLDVKALEAGKTFSELAIRAPISGYLRKIHIKIGSYVGLNTPMFELLDTHHIHADLMVYEKDIAKVQLNQPISLRLQHLGAKNFPAYVFAIGKVVEEPDKAILVHAEIDNLGGDLLPGMYVEANILVGEAQDWVLPEAAVVADGSLHYIFIGEDNEEEKTRFTRIQVIPGIREGGYLSLKSIDRALSSETSVVINGSFFLLAQTKKDAGGMGEEH